MSNYDNKILKNIAEVAARIMEGELSPKQKEIAKLAEPKHKIDAGDLAKLRAMKNEAVEKDEPPFDKPYKSKPATVVDKSGAKHTEMSRVKDLARAKLQKSLKKEDVEQKKTFSEMIQSYKENGLKYFSEMINEEPDNETFTKEVERQKRKAAGTAPESEKAKVSAAATQGVKSMPEEYEIEEEMKVKKNGLRRHTIIQKEEVKLDEMDKSQTPPGRGGEHEHNPNGKTHYVKPVSKKKVEKDALKVLNKSFNKEEVEPLEEITKAAKERLERTKGQLEKMYGKPEDKLEPDQGSHLNLGGARVENSRAAVLAHVKKTFPNAKDIKKTAQYGWGPKHEEVESVDERTLTEPETEKKEKIVKSMKKGLPGFKQRYGERAKQVMYATATKLAKED